MSFRPTIAAIGAGLICALATPAIAQGAPEDADILVEAEREQRFREARQQARDITPRAATIASAIARFQEPICPGTLGLDPESARLVNDRIMYNAEAIGLAVAEGEGCTPNIIVAVVPDPRVDFAELRKLNHPLLRGVDLWERKRVARQDGPVLAWNITQTRTDAGQARGGGAAFDSTQSSRLSLGVREDILLSVVLIDDDVIGEADGVALADYATMRALAETTPPDGDTPLSTVLAMFNKDAISSQRLTEFDLAYLRSIYESRDNEPSQSAFRDLARQMERE